MRTEVKLGLTLGFILLSACASKEPVKKFATTTDDFVKSFNGFASKAKSTCQLKYKYMELDKGKNYNGDPDAGEFKKECDGYDSSYAVLQVYSNTVSTYASSLGKLAGLKSDVFNDEIDNVSGQLGKLKASGGETVDEKAVAAATKLIKSAAESVTGVIVDSKIKKELKSNHDDLVIVIGDMKRFANKIYSKNLHVADNYTESVLEQLKKLSYVPGGKDQFTTILASGTEKKKIEDALGARLPYRMLQAEMYKDKLLIAQENKALTAFMNSCDALVKAHKDLRDDFGELSDKEMLEKIKEFYEKVKDARENFIVLHS